jgi:hypothetical protein
VLQGGKSAELDPNPKLIALYVDTKQRDGSHQIYHLHVAIVFKYESLNLRYPSGPVQGSNGIALPFLLFLDKSSPLSLKILLIKHINKSIQNLLIIFQLKAEYTVVVLTVYYSAVRRFDEISYYIIMVSVKISHIILKDI